MKNSKSMQYPIYTKTKRGYIQYVKHISECECVEVVPDKLSITVESYRNSGVTTVSMDKLAREEAVRCMKEEFDQAMNLIRTKIEAL